MQWLKRIVRIIGCIGLMLVTTLLLASGLVKISSSSVVNLQDGAQVTFNVSKAVRYHAFALHNPERVVIDFYHAATPFELPTVNSLLSPIKRFRLGQQGNNTVRVVMDLKQAMSYRVDLRQPSVTSSGYQVVLTLGKASQTTMASTVKPSSQVSSSMLQPVVSAGNMTVKRSKDIIVVIDPGHGGKDPGATGSMGTHEKNVVLAISKNLAKLINDTPGFKAHLTRTGDYYLTLRQRLDVARKYSPDIFVAIHADAFKVSSARGASVFTLSSKGATSEAARWLAERENQSELMGGVDLADKTDLLKSVLINLSQTASIHSSLLVGQDILNSLKSVARLHNGSVEQAAFVVLKSPDIISLLIETGFLSNRYEERQLRSPAYQKKLALAIKSGIYKYFVSHPPRGTWLAQRRASHEAYVSYTVKRGDTLSEIASSYRTTARAILQLNGLSSSRIYVNQLIKVPVN